VQEVLKLLTGMSQCLNTEAFFNAKQGMYIDRRFYSRKVDKLAACLHCSHTPTLSLSVPSNATLKDLLYRLAHGDAFQFKGELQVGKPGWMPWTLNPANLDKPLVNLGVVSGDPLTLIVADFPTSNGTLVVHFQGEGASQLDHK